MKPHSLVLNPLELHSAEPRKPRHSVAAAAFFNPTKNEIVFTYEVRGSISIDFMKMDGAHFGGFRKDDLWKKTCFESFIARCDEANYREWNFAPNGDWAAYDFSGYREGMIQSPVSKPPVRIFSEQSKVQRWEFTVGFETGLRLGPKADLDLSLTAVIIEAGEMAPYYWAHTHVGPKPDFHRRESFKLKLEIHK